MLHHGTFETTTYYSIKTGVSWNTAFHYLEYFAQQGWIFHYIKGNRDFWKAQSK